MCDAINRLCDLRRNYDDAVLVPNDGVTWTNCYSAAADYTLGLPGLHSGGALLGGCGVAEGGETVVDDLIWGGGGGGG